MSFVVNFSKKFIAEFKINSALANKNMLTEVSEFMKLRIFQNTKRGYYAGVRKNLAKFRPLSQNYIEYRKTLVGSKSNQKLGSFFKPKKANLTLSGEMLDSLDISIDASKKLAKVIVPATGRSDDSGLTNKQVAIKVAEAGRPFMGIDKKGINTITRLIIASVRRQLRARR